jgi:hypothetical protein
MVVAQQPPSGLPLDPRSTDASGTKALVLLLEQVGAEVEILDDLDDLDVDTLLVLVDNFDEATAAEVQRFAEAGGTAVVTDSGGVMGAELRPAGAASAGVLQPSVPRNCDVEALAGVERVRPGSAPLFVVPAGAQGCFGEDDAAWLIIRDAGDGTLVTAGGPAFVTNALLTEADNAVLAAALLAPVPGETVGVLEPQFAATGGGARSLGDLIPGRLVGVALQLLVAFLVVVFWRARRLGKPLRERQLVRLAGSEIVIAMGNLFQRTDARTRAAELLRHDLRRTLAEQLGVPVDLPAEAVADIAAARTGARRDDIVAALAEHPTSEAQLVELAQLVERIRTALKTPAAELAGATRATQ